MLTIDSTAAVLLPIAPFTETPGTFVNAEGRAQRFHAVVKPLGDTRPGWKVLRVLGSMLRLPGFEWETAQDISAQLLGSGSESVALVSSEKLSNKTEAVVNLEPAANQPVVAGIYQLDALVRRASSLQQTVDAHAPVDIVGVAA